MAELGLVCKLPGNHAYIPATVERFDFPSRLNRQLKLRAPNLVWCGDIPFVTAQGRWRYLAVVLDVSRVGLLAGHSPLDPMPTGLPRRWK